MALKARIKRTGALTATLGVLAALGWGSGAAGAATPYTKITAAHFTATGLGPQADQSCDIVYDLYVPDPAVQPGPYPAILTTNGFGGSKNDQSGFADMMASRGYEVLSYSGLGFGGSSCNIEVDSPEWDGRAASELVSLLASRSEVKLDGPGDPVLGTWGGSYGGGFQFALASVDQRVDAMIPMITWNDLAYSLGPNNLGRPAGSGRPMYTNSPPGALKYNWSEVFFADGMAQVALNHGTSGNPATTCPGFDAEVCVINTESAARGFPTKETISFLQHASAQYELFNNPATHVPATMLIQGQNDTLFNINEAASNFAALQARGAPAKLVLMEGGHSGPGAAGENNYGDPTKGYLNQLEIAWFDHYLKGSSVSTGPTVEYFRDWVAYDTTGSAAPAYASASAWPLSTSRTWYLSAPAGPNGGGGLVQRQSAVRGGASTMLSTPAPTSYSEVSEVQSSLNGIAPFDAPGTFLSFSTAALTQALDVVGSPSVVANITAAVPPVDPSSEIVIFAKIYDVDAAGNQTLIHRLVAPVRIANGVLGTPVRFNLPGIVHEFAAGHHIRLTLATGDVAYINSRVPNVYTVTVDPLKPSTLTLPVG